MISLSAVNIALGFVAIGLLPLSVNLRIRGAVALFIVCLSQQFFAAHESSYDRLDTYLSGPVDTARREALLQDWARIRIPECKAPPVLVSYQAAPTTTVITQGDQITRGAWFEHTIATACDTLLETGAMGYVNTAGAVERRLSLPGRTAMPPLTQERVIEEMGLKRPQVAMNEPCATLVIDTQPETGLAPTPDTQVWTEIWTFRNCRKTATASVRFERIPGNGVKSKISNLDADFLQKNDDADQKLTARSDP